MAKSTHFTQDTNGKDSLGANWAIKRRLRNGCCETPLVGGNYFGAGALGSFAYLGRNNLLATSPKKKSLVYLSVEVGESCQLNCRHCIYHRNKLAPEPSELVRDRIEEAIRCTPDQYGFVSFAGKEPTLYPNQLIQLAKTTKRPGHTNILMTNGFALNEKLLKKLEGWIDYFDISLDGDEAAHDWMRGLGVFCQVWKNVEMIIDRSNTKVGVIATAVHSRLPDGRPQNEGILALARQLHDTFGDNDQISLTISLYYGEPSDPLLLDAEEISYLMRELGEIDFPSRVLFVANYAHIWPQVCERLGWDHLPVLYDPATGYPIVARGNLQAVLFNQRESPQYLLRISNDGLIFLSCDHLTLSGDVSGHSIGNLRHESLGEITRRVLVGEVQLMRALRQVPRDCVQCAQWNDCRGGDRLSGLYFDGVPSDPYCTSIERIHS